MNSENQILSFPVRVFLPLLALLALGSKAGAASLLGYYEFEGGYTNSSTDPGAVGDAVPTFNPTQVNIVAGGFRGQGTDINDPTANGGGGNGGSVNIPYNANPNQSPTVSFGGWFNLDSNAGFPGVMAIDNGGWDRGIHLNGNQWGIASGSGSPLAGVAPAPTGVWTYVVGTFDKPNNTATLYVGDSNTLVQTTTSGSRADAGINPGLTQIEIGRYDNQDLDAIVDDMFVFGDALDAHQANAIRNLRLSDLDYSVANADTLFDLFESGGSGFVGDKLWMPASGLSTVNPGELFTLGTYRYGLVLDNAGNGLIGVPEPSRVGLLLLGLLAALVRRRR